MEFSSTISGTPTQLTRLIDELTRGRQMADQLRSMLKSTDGINTTSSESSSVLPFRGMVEKIMDTFIESISIANASSIDSGEVSEVPSPPVNSLVCKSEESNESSKTTKDRRGCYKRRKTSETRTLETPTLYEDGYAWRKYGQKVILHAKHPRNYFRCTHKYDEKCLASKQVQKIKDDPAPLFRTTYHGTHTCKIFSSQIIMDGSNSRDDNNNSSSFIMSFQRHIKDEYNNNDINPAAAVVIKQEEMFQMTKSSSTTSHDSDDHYFNIPTTTTLDHQNHYEFSSSPFDHSSSLHNLNGFSSGGVSDDVISSTDVYSCTASTHSHSMDHMIYSFDDLPEF